MRQSIKHYSYYLSLLFISLLVSTKIQGQETIETANQVYKSGNFKDAAAQYSKLYAKYSKDPKFNFQYGSALVEINKEIALASKCLKFASLKTPPKETFFYLARAYQLSYEFEEAITTFNKYLKLPTISESHKLRALKHIEESKTSINFTSKHFTLTVLSADTINKGDELPHIKTSPEFGKLMYNSDFFESGIDPNGILYSTERSDRAFYVSKNETSNNQDIFLIEKLLDGWSKPRSVGEEINTEFDEAYPVLLTDGSTLYFSSNRLGGMGGWDIYKATYDADTKTFANITNMGIPFNSPMDDYFFTPDSYTKKAWIATNRSTETDKTTIIKIVWDQSIVKNTTIDINQIKLVATLPLSENDSSEDSNINSQSNLKKEQKSGDFSFMISDTLEYTKKEHFRSQEALNEFNMAQSVSFKKDSLSTLMRQKRARFSAATTDWERNAMVNEILKLEKETYSLDASMNQHIFNAQNLEQTKIKALIKSGEYQSIEGMQVIELKSNSFNKSQMPNNLTLYSADEFGQELEKIHAVYPRLFSENSIYKLQQADSLYAWGHLLNIESARLLEQAAKPIQTTSPTPKLTNSEQNIELDPNTIATQSKELKYKALQLYHQSLDIKYNIYNTKHIELQQQKEIKLMIDSTKNQASSFYTEASELQKDAELNGYIELYEKSGTLKRKAVQTQEAGFYSYLNYLDAPTTSEKEVQSTSSETVVATMPIANKQPASNKIIYKIQIGVFRNAPNAEALSKLPEITTEKIVANETTKYFTGQYNSYNQASAQLPMVKDAGFPSAFIVAFENGKQISIQKAQNLE